MVGSGDGIELVDLKGLGEERSSGAVLHIAVRLGPLLVLPGHAAAAAEAVDGLEQEAEVVTEGFQHEADKADD